MDSTLIAPMDVPDEVFATDDEAIDVFCWRMEELMSAGYSAVIAGTLADRTDINLHAACLLRRRGCDEQTAFHILN